MSYLRQTFETNLTRFLVILLGMITNIIITRSLGPTLKGEYSSVFALYEIVLYFSLFGISSSIVYSGAQSLKKAQKVAFFSLLFTLTNGALATTMLIVISLTSNPFNKNITPEYLIYISFLPVLSVGILYLSSLLLSRQLIREMNLASFASSFIQATLVVILVLLNLIKIKNLILINYLSSIIVFIYLLAIIIKKIGVQKHLDFSLFKEMIQISFKTYLIALIGYIIIRSDVILLNIIKGNYDVGIYTVAAGLSLKILDIPSITSQLLRPRAIADPEGTFNFQLKVSRVMSFIMGCLLFISAFLISPAIRILYGKAFMPSVMPYLLLLPGIYFYSAVSQITPYYTARAYPPVTLISPFIAALSNIILNLLLIPEYGYNAAAFTSSISYFLFFAVYYLDFYRRERVPLNRLLIPDRDDMTELLNRIKQTGVVKRFAKK